MAEAQKKAAKKSSPKTKKHIMIILSMSDMKPVLPFLVQKLRAFAKVQLI